ncbi:CAZyme family CE4 [Purpureocillium lilacinum]|uniref:CAZyme family CE4 n=1 Tax=Purpureocillium lilacinum TaxID=33203 RepID=A0ABR0BT57_PURLI|nr:CAZyme family CE4 [Purpureocillium lilacinum]
MRCYIVACAVAATLAGLGATHPTHQGRFPIPNLMTGLRNNPHEQSVHLESALERRRNEQDMSPAWTPNPARAATPNPRWNYMERRQTVSRCGADFGGAICDPGYCCSSAGWCGLGYLYCSAPSCQINYGPGCDANTRPCGSDTTNVSRPQLGSVPYGVAIYHCEVYGDIALTYDDGPWDYTSDLLDLLKNHSAKATFFVTGNNLGKGQINDPSLPWPGIIRRMIAEGHQVASHTWAHQRLTDLTADQVRDQMLFNEVAFNDILGYFPTYMRPPYSASNAQVDSILGDLGYHVTYFNLDTEGYLHDDPNTIQQSKDIWDGAVEGANTATTKWLQIEHDPVWQSVYNLTGYMLESLFRNGFRSVTVGECLGDPSGNWYRTGTSGPSTCPSTTSGAPTPTPTVGLPSTDGRCGVNFNGTTCVNQGPDRCCSPGGWCVRHRERDFKHVVKPVLELIIGIVTDDNNQHHAHGHAHCRPAQHQWPLRHQLQWHDVRQSRLG